MKLKFGLELYPHGPYIGCHVTFGKNIEQVYPSLRGFGNKKYKILAMDDTHFKISRGDIWISKYVIDGRLSKLLARYQQL